MPDLSVGLSSVRSLIVREEHTAVQWGSGAVAVFSTPHMIALMEGAAVDAVDQRLSPGQQTVGTSVQIEHLAPTPVGGCVAARATLTAIEGRRLFFELVAEDAAGVIGRGTHERVVVDAQRFMARAASRLAPSS